MKFKQYLTEASRPKFKTQAAEQLWDLFHEEFRPMVTKKVAWLITEADHYRYKKSEMISKFLPKVKIEIQRMSEKDEILDWLESAINEFY